MSSSVRFPRGGGNWQSQQLTNSENRTMKGKGHGKSHSWWWDSHNAPKNSKWLEDNLNDMDSKVKAMLKLIEEDADSFAKRAEMYYKKRPELVSLVEEFYRAYRSLAERYDQLSGQIRQIPQDIQAQFGVSGDASPGSPGSGSVKRRAAGFSVFANSGTLKHSKEKGRKDGSDSSSSSSSDSDSDSKGKPKQSDAILRIQEENEQLRKDLDKGVADHQALETRLAGLQEELKSLQLQNVQLHRNAAASHSEIASLEAEIERLKRENHALGEEALSAVRTAEKLQKELDLSQDEQRQLSIRLEEAGLLLQNLEEKIKELEARILQITEDLLSSTASCRQLEQELAAVLQERNSLLDDVSTKTAQILELEEEIARFRASLSVSESEREKHFELHQSLERTLADVHVEFSSVREEKGKLSEELLFKVQHGESLEQQLKQVQVTLEGSERERTEVVELLNKVESRLLDLQKEFGSMQERLNGEISAQANEKNAYKKQVEELEAALAALHSEKSRGVELQDVLAKRLTDLELQLREANGALELAEREKTEVSGLLHQVKNSFLELQGEFGSMEVKLNIEALEKQALNTQVEELQAALEAMRGERSQGLEFQRLLEKQVTELELQLKQVQEALEVSDKEKFYVSRLLSELENNFSKLQHDFGSMQEKLTGEVSIHAQDKQFLREQVEDLQALVTALRGESSRGLELHDVLEKRLTDLEKQLAQVQAALEQAEREKAEVGGLLSKAEIHVTELQSEVLSVQARLNEDISTLSQEKQVLIEQLEKLQATLAAFQGEKSRGLELQDIVEKQLKQLQLELSLSKHEASSLSDELAEKVGAILQLEGEVRSRDETVQSLQVDLLAKQEEGESLKNQLEECSRDFQSFESEVQKLRALLIESEDVAKTLEAQIVEIQQSFQLEKTECAKLRDDLKDKVTIIGRFEAEVQNRDILIISLQDEISTKVEEIRVLREEMNLMMREKMSLSEESFLNLGKIALLRKELDETLETIAERRSFILNLEMEYKRLTEDLSESHQKTALHLSQWELVTGDRDRLELELILLQEANAKLQAELGSRNSQVERLMSDLKIIEETVSGTKKENAKLIVDLELEVTRSRSADEKCLLQEQVIGDFQEGKAKLAALVEESELTISKLMEEIENLKASSEHTHQEKEALKLEIEGLRDEFIKVKQMNEQQSSQQLEMISYLKVEISKLELRLANGTEQLRFFEKEQEGWNKDRGVLDESINQLTKEKQELQDTILMWSERVEKLQTEHTTLRTSSRDVESSLFFHQTEHSRAKTELIKKSESIQWLEEELKRLQSELMSSQEDTRKLSIKLQQVTQDLKDQLIAEEGKVLSLHGDIDRLQQDLRSAQKARETEAIACQGHVKVFEIKEKSLESQIVKLKQNVYDLDELCKELARNLEDKTKEQEISEVQKVELHHDLLKTRQQWESAEAKCGSLASELAKEHENRVTAEAAREKFEAEIAKLLVEIARLQAELLKLKEANESLTVKLEAALEQERLDATEIQALLRVLQGEHEDNGSPAIGGGPWHFEAKHSTFRHLKESMVILLTEKSRVKQEAAAHAEHVKVLNLEIAKSGQMLDTTRGDYHTLLATHESSLSDLGVLQLRVSHFEGQVQVLEEEKKKLHDQLIASVNDSDVLSAELLREKKELYEKLVAESEHVLKLQKELKVVRAESVEKGVKIDDLHKQIEKLLLDIQEISEAKEEQEKRLSQEVQQHAVEKATAVQSLTEALGALSIEKAEVLRQQEENFFKDQKLVKLEEEIALLRATLLEKEQEFCGLQQQKDSLESRLEAEILKLEESWTLWQEEKSSLSSSLTLNEQKAIAQLGLHTREKEEISLELQEKVVLLNFHQEEIQRLQKLLEESELVIISLRDEKISVSEQYASSVRRCNDLEALCESLQKQLAEYQVEKRGYEAQLPLIEKLRKEALDYEEMLRLIHERVASKQQEIDQVQCINEDLKERMRNFEREIGSLKEQIIILQKKNTTLNEEVSTKASLIKELDQSFTSLKEKKVVFEGGFVLAVGNVGLLQAEVDKLLEKISKSSTLSLATGENVQKMEERICKLQVSNLNLRDEITGFAKKEKSYVIAVRFMRAEFFCLVQRIKAMKEEKAEVAMSAELALEAERKKNGEILFSLNQELAFLREENKRQRAIVFDRAEEKREAIRQLSATIDFMQTKNRRLEGVINTVREKIQRRIAASDARRR